MHMHLNYQIHQSADSWRYDQSKKVVEEECAHKSCIEKLEERTGLVKSCPFVAADIAGLINMYIWLFFIYWVKSLPYLLIHCRCTYICFIWFLWQYSLSHWFFVSLMSNSDEKQSIPWSEHPISWYWLILSDSVQSNTRIVQYHWSEWMLTKGNLRLDSIHRPDPHIDQIFWCHAI